MRLRFRLLGLAAAAGALGTGCEFWSNLTGGKTADRADLEITVRDAFTGAPMPGVSCTLAVDSRAAESDAEGRIRWEAVPTGPGKVRCGEVLYHPAEADVGVRRAGGAATVEMARLGGASWYDEDSLRVGLTVSEVAGGLRYPGGVLRLRATPARSDGKLVYQWSSTAPRPEPPRTRTETPEVLVRNGDMPGDLIEDHLVVKVVARLGDTVYEVGTDTLILPLARNRKPGIVLATPAWADTQKVRVCGERPRAPGLAFTASDPDGSCRKVRLRSLRANSSLGSYFVEVDCDKLPRGFRPPLNMSSLAGEVSPDILNVLGIEVEDDNGDTALVQLAFITNPNLLPKLELVPLGAGTGLRAGEPLELRLSVRDEDNPVAPAVVDWRDGTTSRYQPLDDRANQGDTTFTHVYAKEGDYVITARAWDACGDTAALDLPLTVQPARAAAPRPF